MRKDLLKKLSEDDLDRAAEALEENPKKFRELSDAAKEKSITARELRAGLDDIVYPSNEQARSL